MNTIEQYIAAGWEKLKAACMYSWTIAGSYVMMFAGFVDEAKLVDWNTVLGTVNGGRIAAFLGVTTFLLRIRTIIKPGA